MRYINICVRRRSFFGGCALLAITLLLLWTTALSTKNNQQIHQIGKISGIPQLRKFSVLVADVIFDQPWPIDPITPVNSIDYFLQNHTQRYIIGDFTYSPGLGNLMFQYAALKSICLDNNAQLIVPVNCTLRRAFRLNVTFVSDEVFEELVKMLFNSRIDFQMCCRYYPPNTYQLFQLSDRNIEFLTGYFQSFRYFYPAKDKFIRQEFKFLPEIERKAKELVEMATKAMIKSKNVTAMLNQRSVHSGNISESKSKDEDLTYVGIHVRKGADITIHAKNLAHGHTTATEEYFMHAMEYFRNKYGNVLFIIASDNPLWVKRHIKPAVAGEIFILQTRQREIDLAALTLCNHTILSTGTFSWWAGYLAAGEAVYYKNWPLKDSALDIMVEKSDFFMPNWISME